MLFWILNISGESGKAAHWLVHLSELEFNVVRIAYANHPDADTLLWLPTDREETNDLNKELPVLKIVLQAEENEVEMMKKDHELNKAIIATAPGICDVFTI